MNLARAKTVLIAAFLGLNLFLGYHLYLGGVLTQSRLAVTIEQIEATSEKLAEAGYFVDADLDRAVRTSAFLTVQPSVEHPREIIGRVTGRTPDPIKEDETTYYKAAGVRAGIQPGGLMQIRFEPPCYLLQGSREVDEQILLSAVDHFLEEWNLTLEYFKFDFIENKGAQTVIHYYQQFNGAPLYAGYQKIFLQGDSITGIDMFILETAEWPPKQKMEVIPVTEALVRLVEELGVSTEPCYLVKAELGFFSREYDAEKWEVPPVWRFMTGDGKSYYINAFTGNLEAD